MVEVNGTAGEMGYYRRLCAKCPIHGAGCGKRRNTGPSQCSRFGEAEPYAFIGAWLRAGSEYPDRDSHISFAPTVDIVQDYLQSSKDVIAAILGTPGHAPGS